MVQIVSTRDFPSSPLVNSVLPLQGAPVPSLVLELRQWQGEKKKKKNGFLSEKIKTINFPLFSKNSWGYSSFPENFKKMDNT